MCIWYILNCKRSKLSKQLNIRILVQTRIEQVWLSTVVNCSSWVIKDMLRWIWYDWSELMMRLTKLSKGLIWLKSDHGGEEVTEQTWWCDCVELKGFNWIEQTWWCDCVELKGFNWIEKWSWWEGTVEPTTGNHWYNKLIFVSTSHKLLSGSGMHDFVHLLHNLIFKHLHKSALMVQWPSHLTGKFPPAPLLS